MSDIIFTKVFIQVGDALGIRMGGKDMPPFRELLTELPIIVDFSIEDDDHGTIFIVDRLTPAVDINDCQTSHTQSDLTIEVKSLVIRPSSGDQRTHPPDQRLINLSRLFMNDSYNATHKLHLSDSHAVKRWHPGTFSPSAADHTPSFPVPRS